MVDNPTLGRLQAECLLDSGPVSSQKMACVSECVRQGHTCICNEVRLTAAAAKSLQLCLTLCDPVDGSTLGSSIPGILQARILEWVAILYPTNSFPKDRHCLQLHHLRCFSVLHEGTFVFLWVLCAVAFVTQGFPGGKCSDGNESACKAGDLGLIPELGISSGEGYGNPL